MRTLRITDGTEPHLRAILFHVRRCREKAKEPFFQKLQEEGQLAYQALYQKSLEVSESNERLLDLNADIDGAENEFENEVRNASDDIAKLDRKSPELNVYQQVFPKGLTRVIQAERKSQIQPALDMISRLQPFLSHEPIAEAEKKLRASLSELEACLAQKEAEEKRFQNLFTLEQNLRQEVRSQLTSAHGRLTDRYKQNPNLAENFFIPDPRVGSTALSQAETRGRLNGKVEVLLNFFEKKKVPLPTEKRDGLLQSIEEEKLDQWLYRLLDGTSLQEISDELPSFKKEENTEPKE